MPFTYHVALAHKILHCDYDQHNLTNYKTKSFVAERMTPVSPTERPGFSR